MQSEDATARLVVHPYTGRFAVCYPLLVQQQGTPEHAQQDAPEQAQPGDLIFTYIWQTQVFAEADYPQRWHFPLQLALEARARPELLPQQSQQDGPAELTTQTHSSDPASLAAQPQLAAATLSEAGSAAAAAEPSKSQAEQQLAQAQGGASDTTDANSQHAAQGSPSCQARSTAVQRVTDALAGTGLADESAPGINCADTTPAKTPRSSVLQRTTQLPRASIAEAEGPNFVQDGTWWTGADLAPFPEQVLMTVRCTHGKS